MTASRPDNAAIFHAAREIPDPERRREFVMAACDGNAVRIDHIEALLAAADVPDSLLDCPAWSDTASAHDPIIAESHGTKIGPYKLIEQIGQGGMGTVWMAQQNEPVKRVVAIKLIKAGMDSKQVIARFGVERQALALMDHQNIARVIDAGTTEGGRPYFVMDLVKGMPITQYCDEHHLTPRQRLELLLPVCQAVQHAHQKGIIHRDLKPSNVLVALYDGKPVPKIIDFGVAKATGQSLTEKTLVTGFGNIVGTLEYMSPEQAEFNQPDIDTRSDIYSLGVLLYELLTGSPPFSRKALEKAGMLEMLRIIREEEPSKPSTKLSTADGLPTLAANRGTEPAKLTKLLRGELDWIVMKALEKDRSRRYETANGFARDVQRYLADEPVQACPPTAGYRLRKFVRRNRSAVFLSASVAVMAGVLASGSVLYRQATQEAEQKRQESERAQRVTEAHEKIPMIQAAIRQEQHQIAFNLLQEIEPLVPNHPSLSDLWDQCSQSCTVTTHPEGVDVWLRPYDQPGVSWQHVIQTLDQTVSVRVPRGEHLWRATKKGYGEVTGLRLPQKVSFVLDQDEALPNGMVRVPDGIPNRPAMAFMIAFQPVELPAFLIDRHEVTNVQYEQFVRAGGYDRSDYWTKLPFIDDDGKATSWENVKPRLVDQTGRPGPANWRNGTFPPGEAEHPVRGVSWYEAMAYARFAGKSLPTIYHWVQASQIELSVVLAGSPFITRSNFGSQIRSVKALNDHGIHGTFGTMGNVKEWCFNDRDDGQRFILGGSCGEPIYTPITLDSSNPIRRDEFFGFRCMKFLNGDRVPAMAWEKAARIPWPAPPKRDELLDDATFRLVIRDRFVYDRTAPLDVTSEQTDEGDWFHVTARINTAYRDVKGRWERMTVHLYLPKGVDKGKGVQTVVYFPGADAQMLPRIRPLAEEYGLDAIVRSGRAVLLPIYQGTYERRQAAPFDDDAMGSEAWKINVGHDLMRAIDYLQQRGDIDMNQLGYYGFSFGAEWAGSLVAFEPRLRAIVFEAGGLSNEPLRKDRPLLEWRHYLPQIKAPVLMLNGRADTISPLKESQVPMFHLLGSPIKEHYIHPNGHHMLPLDVKFEQMLRWFDRHLGKPAIVPMKR
jgi:serine/threonine protein kinase